MDPRPRILLLAWLCGCGVEHTPPLAEHAVVAADAADDGPLKGGLDSLDAVGRAAVAGLNAGDEAALRGLLLAEVDFTGRLFDALSNHASARQMGPELIYAMQRRESEDELARALERFGGRDLRFLALEPAAVETAAGATLYRRPLLRLEDAGGAQMAVELLGTVVEHTPSHTFKLLSYRCRG